ncbi:NAD(P)/FAD-dependent oxidoreductase [Paenibacillus etheri]|uniref:NADH:flavin oxidoreductase n=1 Tax=Paenibacillus etheri TaxID=1306852 RepID=A0A0W1ATI1_9BACL|nr:NAD(P)/FAD-dependent oxidoreductase [Paenibacillus etheri]KTD84606.1 NADH:flavin oxidoreductase [Paenibacillus etheri]
MIETQKIDPTTDYSRLFTPFKIGNMEVKNRIVLSPMGTGSSKIDGSKSNSEIRYYEERARGGAGMIILGCQLLTEELAQGSLEGTLEKEHVIPKLTELVEAVQRYGTKVVCQISPGTGRNAFPSMYGEPPVSASPIPAVFDPSVTCHALTVPEIAKIMEQFTNSADIAKKAGFDAIEIHGHAGYLIDQFMSPVWNKREDEYGGSDENRARFARDIIRALRKAVGPNMPIMFRISLDHRFEGGRTLEDSMPLIQLLEAEGVDALDIDSGSYETLDYIFPPAYLGDACMEYVCEMARKHVNIPLLNSGNHTPETAIRLLESGNADFVMFGRPLIADPELPNKLMRGCREDVRPCIRCNEECIGRIVNRLTKLSCAVNIQAAEEQRFKLVKTEMPKKVLVIGAGPAGLEAARVAATIGHQVILVEKEHEIGGQLRVAATPQFKSQLRDLVKWFGVQLNKLKVDVRLNTELQADDSLLDSADRIILAAGALPIEPPILGLDYDNVISVVDAHLHKDLVKGKRIVICGGGLSACDSAIELAQEHGKQVTVIEMRDAVAKDVMFINTISIYRMFDEYGIKQRTNSRVTSIDKVGVHITKLDGSNECIPADTVITAFGMKPDRRLAESIQAKYHAKTRVVGDSDTVGNVGTAVRGGYYAAISLED